MLQTKVYWPHLERYQHTNCFKNLCHWVLLTRASRPQPVLHWDWRPSPLQNLFVVKHFKLKDEADRMLCLKLYNNQLCERACAATSPVMKWQLAVVTFNPDLLLPRCHFTFETAVAGGMSCLCCVLETKAKIWGVLIVNTNKDCWLNCGRMDEATLLCFSCCC